MQGGSSLKTMSIPNILKARTEIIADLTKRFAEGETNVAKEHGVIHGAGSIDCPVCEKGTLRYSRASNGHVHALCTNADCVRWME